MTAAIVTLAVAAAGLTLAVVLLVRWGMDGWNTANTNGDLYRETVKLRDQYAVDVARLKQENAIATTRLKIAEKQRNDAQTAERQKIAARIRAAKPDEAAKVVNEILAEPIQSADATGLISVVKPAPVVDIRTGGPIGELK